ncbi:MAG: hypothetical protein PHD46_06620 [Eubacteriales bacterium]|nr:hypothetical protein [Eubacteriales bacterium]MDD4422691.1 hypothetical protein [Eubacteriales bacterium]HBR30642.1 hypothetical protein [Clostridiales bacterium]
MKKNEVFEERYCFYCEHSTPIMDTEVCVCDINGIVKAEATCKKFKLDLLKIKPRPRRIYKNSDPELLNF